MNTITIIGSQNNTVLPVLFEKDGLCITPMIYIHKIDHIVKGYYTITHTSSTHALIRGIYGMNKAKTVLQKFLDLPVNWNQTEQEMYDALSNETRNEMNELRYYSASKDIKNIENKILPL